MICDMPVSLLNIGRFQTLKAGCFQHESEHFSDTGIIIHYQNPVHGFATLSSTGVIQIMTSQQHTIRVTP